MEQLQRPNCKTSRYERLYLLQIIEIQLYQTLSYMCISLRCLLSPYFVHLLPQCKWNFTKWVWVELQYHEASRIVILGLYFKQRFA